MWLYCCGTDSANDGPILNIVLYEYQNSRIGQCTTDFLASYSGYLQVDGYQGYAKTLAILVACMAHARRKFVEAETAHRSADRPKDKTGKANWALNHMQKLYRIETTLKNETSEEKHRIRLAEVLPLLTQFKDWLDKSA
jgi:transposase